MRTNFNDGWENDMTKWPSGVKENLIMMYTVPWLEFLWGAIGVFSILSEKKKGDKKLPISYTKEV